MATIQELQQVRIKKLKAIERAGFLAYPARTKRTHQIKEALNKFTTLSRLKKEIVLVGRIRSIREHGGSCFIHFEDGTGRIQAYFRKNLIGEKAYQFFLDYFDIGDFIELRGTLFKTKTGEKTIQVADFKMLSKSLLPLPEKWHGLQDIEERYRKRYLDLIFNSEIKEKFKIRFRIIKEIRNFLEKEGFLEVETPILQAIYGGAKAKPFKTHLNALDLDLYLRIAPELYLKRLLIAGFEKVYEIGRIFRNEGMDRAHNPEFTSLEMYWAYADYKDMMRFTESMISTIVKKIFKKKEIEYQGKKINFEVPWQRIEFSQLFRKYTKIDLDEIHPLALEKKAKELGVKFEKGANKAEVADSIYKKYCRDKIWQPCFVIHHPVGSFPLAKSIDKSNSKLASFQIIIAGWELALGFSELNDPLEQEKRFKQQEESLKKGFKEAQRMDKDFIEALQYGMPPAAGFGLGIDRLVALLTNSHSLREVILFPLMRSR